MAGSEEKIRRLFEDIAQRIRELREEQGLSVAALAKRAGFTRSYLSQIERLKREPTIGTLGTIADALGTDVFALIGGEPSNEEEELSLVRSEDRRIVALPSHSAKSVFESINYRKKDRLFEGYVLTEDFQFSPEPVGHEGQELLFMLEGSQEFIYDGKSFILEAGDCVCFDSVKPHQGKSIGDRACKALVVVTRKPH
jgi:transcriptional regulator with XRE-family HTH domain